MWPRVMPFKRKTRAGRGPHLCANPDQLGCVDGVCQPLPTKGQACTVDNRCAAGLGCDFAREGSLCRAPSTAAGQPCTNDSMCASAESLYCDFGSLTCASRKGRRGRCTDGNECAPGLTCFPPPMWGSWRCKDAPDTGDRCLLDCKDPADYCG